MFLILDEYKAFSYKIFDTFIVFCWLRHRQDTSHI